jgi:hypothetical protein
MDIWTWVWIGWGVFFGIAEGVGLYRESKHKARNATLSEHVWHWFAVVDPKGPRWWIHGRRIVGVLFMAELTVHFASGRWWV